MKRTIAFIFGLCLCFNCFGQLKGVVNSTPESIVYKGDAGFKNIPAIKFSSGTYFMVIKCQLFDKYKANVTHALTGGKDHVPVTLMFDEKKKIVDFLETCINLYDQNKKNVFVYTLGIKDIGELDVTIAYGNNGYPYVNFLFDGICADGAYSIQKLPSYYMTSFATFIYVGKKKAWTQEMIDSVNNFKEP